MWKWIFYKRIIENNNCILIIIKSFFLKIIWNLQLKQYNTINYDKTWPDKNWLKTISKPGNKNDREI